MAGKAAPEAVVNCELFSGRDFSETVQENSASASPHRQIRITAVVDEFSAAPSGGCIENKSSIKANRVDTLWFPGQEHPHGTAHVFAPTDPLARVLDHPLVRGDRFCREHTIALDA